MAQFHDIKESPYHLFDQATELLVKAAHGAIDERDYHTASRALTALKAIYPQPRAHYGVVREVE